MIEKREYIKESVNFNVEVGEVDKTIDIMREVAQWCTDTRRKTWTLEELTKDKLTLGLNNDNFCIGKTGNNDACCMILQWYDPLFWPDAKILESGYIHKLCVRRRYSGIGLSEKLIEYAKNECRKRNVPYLRLDTQLHNMKLCSLYESFGFIKVGEKILERGEFALFEMSVF